MPQEHPPPLDTTLTISYTLPRYTRGVVHMPTKLERGIEAAKAGQIDTARQLLAASVEEDPNNEKVWLWLTAVTDDEGERRVFLKQMLRINPDSQPARHGLALLDAQQAQPTQSPGEPERQPLAADMEPAPAAEGVLAPPEPGFPGGEELVATEIIPPEQLGPELDEEPFPAAAHPIEAPVGPSEQEPPPQEYMPTEPESPGVPEIPATDAFAPTVAVFHAQPAAPAADAQRPTEPMLLVDQEAAVTEPLAPAEEMLPPEEEVRPTGRVVSLRGTPAAADQWPTTPAILPEPWPISPGDEEPVPEFTALSGAKAGEPASRRALEASIEAPADADYIRADWPPVDDERPEPGLWQPLAPPGAAPEAGFPPGLPADVWQQDILAGEPAAGAAEAPAGGLTAFLGGVSPLVYVAAAILTITIAIIVLWVAFPSLRDLLTFQSTRPPAESAVVVSEPTKQPQLMPMLESNVTVVSARTATPCGPCAGGTSVAVGATATAGLPTAGPAPNPSGPASAALPPVEPSALALPAPSVPNPVAWIVAYVSQSPADGTVHSLAYLQEEAIARGIEFQVYAHEASFLQALQQPGVTAALYGGTGSTEALWSLKDLVSRGGRVVLLYNDAWQAQNELLQILFGVRVESEQVVATEDTFVYPPTLLLPDWLSGLNLALRQEGSSLALPAYLVAAVPGGEQGQIASQASGQNRLLVWASPEKDVTFWPAVTVSPRPGASKILDYFFSDRSIGRFANLGGAGRLLDRLVGR